MLSALVLIATLASQPQPGSIADQASRPHWTVAETPAGLVTVDQPPAVIATAGSVDANFWVFDVEGDINAIAAAVTIDCDARTITRHSLSAYAGTTFVGAAAATDVTAEPGAPNTVFGRVVEHLCDLHPEARPDADFSDFRAVQAARLAASGAR